MRAIDPEAVKYLDAGGTLELNENDCPLRINLKYPYGLLFSTLLKPGWTLVPIPPPETTTDLKVALGWADAGDNAEAGGYLLCKTSGSRPGYQIVNNWAHAIGLSTWPAEMLTGPWTRVKS